MARRNEHGLELSFKRYGSGRKGGRWLKIIDGKPAYFGTGKSRGDRASYNAALEKYNAAVEEREQQAALPERIAALERLLSLPAGPLTGTDLEFVMDVGRLRCWRAAELAGTSSR